MVPSHSVGVWGSTDLGKIKIGHFISLAVEEASMPEDLF